MAIDNTAYDVGNGKILYDNAPTVCCVALGKTDQSILLVKRKFNPKAGLWALPGGYQMRGETMAQAASRELQEETGLIVGSEMLELRHIQTDSYGNNLAIFGMWRYNAIPEGIVVPITPGDDAEEAAFIPYEHLGRDMNFWAFPLHKDWAWREALNFR